jgi:O-antigen/teichoic acid export membrane protein
MEDLATYRQSLLIYQVAIPFLGLGMGSAILFFLPLEVKRRKAIVLETILVCTFTGFIFATFLWLGGNEFIAKHFDNENLINSLLLISILAIFAAPNIVINPLLVVLNKVTTLSIYQVGTNLCVGIGVIFACVYYGDPLAMVGARVGLLILGALLGLKVIWTFLPKGKAKLSRSSAQELISYGLPLSLSMCVGTLSLQLDKIIVSVKATPETFAIYSNGAMEIPIIGIITSSICLVMLVPFRKHFGENNLDKSKAIYQQVSDKISFILLPVMIYFGLCAKPFILLMYSDKYIESVLPFLLYLLIIPSRTILQGAMAAVGKGKILLRNSIVSLCLNATLTLVLVSYYGYLGAIIATIITLYCWDVVISLREISLSLKCRFIDVYPFDKLIKTIFAALLPAIPTYFILGLLNNLNEILQLIIIGLVYFPLYLLIGIKFKLFSPDVLSYMKVNFNKIKLKLTST